MEEDQNEPELHSSDSSVAIDMTAFAMPIEMVPAQEDSSDSSGDEFYQEELVWPDPESRFDKSSGIKPATLTADLHQMKEGVMDFRPKTRCDSAMVIRKRPRPKNLPWNVLVIKSDPPVIECDDDDMEEFLVHDPLFVEYFNAFLALPTFPEPICFNLDTGGFEVVTDKKQKLAQQIKEALRSQNVTAKMYRVARQHAFSDIPLIPIEDVEGPEAVKIDTAFPVTTLNKDQGIYWVKAERLPIFLESDFYCQYRLAKVISQARIFNEKGEYIIMKLDYTSKPRMKRKQIEVAAESIEDKIVKDLCVSFGDMKGALKEQWFTEAKAALDTEPTFTSLGTRACATVDSAASAPTVCTKAKEKSSVFHSQYFGVYSPGLIGPDETEPPINDANAVNQHMFAVEKPFTPRPSDRIHASTALMRTRVSRDPTAEEEMVLPGSTVYVWPKGEVYSTDSESGFGDIEEKEDMLEKKIMAHRIIDQIYNDGTWEEGGVGKIVLKNIDELGSVIVGAIMKKTVADLLNEKEERIVTDPAISNIYPSEDLTCVSVDKLELCIVAPEKPELPAEYMDVPAGSLETPEVLVEAPEKTDEEALEEATQETPMVAPVMETPKGDSLESIPDKEPIHMQWKRPLSKSAEDDSEEDSLLDSDEDFEERDIHFRRFKDKWHSLTTMKGILAFRKFLEGTQGERFWELWIDIDKGRLIQDETEKLKYIMYMREKYYKKGAQCELSAEDRKKLGLESISSWCPEYLFQVQAKVLEPLLLYWAPRYLLKHLLQAHPEKDYIYNHMKSCVPVKESDPFPHTQDLMPLRPKSCCPRIRTGPGLETKSKELELETTPKIGNRRVFGEDTLRRLANTATAKYLKIKPPETPHPKAKSTMVVERKTFRSEVSSSKHKSMEMKPSLQLSGSAELKEDTQKEKPSPTRIQSKESFIGKLPGIESRSSRPSYSASGGRLSSKKSKDLLTPKLEVPESTGGRYKRMESAPVKRIPSQDSTNYTFYRQDSQESETLESKKEKTADQIIACDFLGSQQMEFLLRALHQEDNSGRSFRKYIEKCERQDWRNLLDFWERVQTYRKQFYKDKLDLHHIAQQARSIFAQFIVDGAPWRIGVSESIELSIIEHLTPPFEDLYDEAEEYALKILFEVFQDCLKQDEKSYSKVERGEVLRHLETKNVNIINLQEKGIIKERPLTPEDPMEGFIDPVYDESILERVPEQFRSWTLDKLLHNRLEMEHFRQYLADNYAEIDLKCWLDIEAWRRTNPEDSALRDARAINIKKLYLNKKYFFGPSSPATKEGQNKVMQVGGGWGKYLDDKPHSNSILESQKYVRSRLENKHLWLFLQSDEFLSRQKTDEPISEQLDDAYLPKKTRSMAVQKVIGDAESAFYRLIEKRQPNFDAYGKLVLPQIQQRTLFTKNLARPSAADLKPKTSVDVVSDTSETDQPYELVKLLESKWVSSTREIFLFKKTLENPVSCSQFRKFASIHGDNLENDVLFWLEVQKYKSMHHQHTEDSLLAQKINAIINCFIDSSIPPSLQIDIPQEMADRILEHKHEKGPYLFRDAQLATFRVMLSHWGAFREFRSNLTHEKKANKTLDRHRAIAKQKEQEYREEMARQREKERLKRLEQEELEAAMVLSGYAYHEAEIESEKEDVVQFLYSDYLAEQQMEEETPEESALGYDSVLVTVVDRGTQTFRPKGNRSAETPSKLGSEVGEKLLENADDISNGKENNTSLRRRSSATERRRTSEASGIHKRGSKGEQSEESAEKVKKESVSQRPKSGKRKSLTNGLPERKNSETKENGSSIPVVKTEFVE